MLAAFVAAATIPAAGAYAVPGEAQYPSDFVQTLDLSTDGLTDYAVNGSALALASKTTIHVLTEVAGSDGSSLVSTNVGTEVTALDYAEGTLYYKIASGNAYAFPDVPDTAQPVEHEFPQPTRSITLGNNQYTIDSDGKLEHFDTSPAGGERTSVGDGYSLLKQFGGVAYAVKDNCPQKLDGTTATPLSLKYTDFSPATQVATGTIAEKLKNPAYVVKTGTLKTSNGQNRYYTRINPEKIGEHFETVGEQHTLKTTATKACLILAEEGNLSVIVMDGNCYITATDNIEETAYSSPVNDWPAGSDGTRKAYIRESTGIYASPYMCASTLLERIDAANPVAVTVKEKFALDFFGSGAEYYRVEYTDAESNVKSGFVAAGFLDKYDYATDGKEPEPSGDEDFAYGTNVMTVVLVLIVVALVIVAIAYLTIVGTKPDKKDKKGKKAKKINKGNDSDPSEDSGNAENPEDSEE